MVLALALLFFVSTVCALSAFGAKNAASTPTIRLAEDMEQMRSVRRASRTDGERDPFAATG